MDCFEGKPYRKPLFLPPNIGGSCRFSLEAILGLIALIKWWYKMAFNGTGRHP